MLTYITQIRHNECHVAVCLMFIKSLYEYVSYNDIKKKLEGCSFYDMRKVLLSYGIKCISYNINVRNLRYIDFNYMIVQMRGLFGNHMIILEKDNNKIYYYDPAKTRRKKFKNRMIRSMSGNVMMIYGDYEFKKYKTFNLSYNFRIVSIFSAILTILLFVIYYLNY